MMTFEAGTRKQEVNLSGTQGGEYASLTPLRVKCTAHRTWRLMHQRGTGSGTSGSAAAPAL
eukprot:4205081-Prorocentrum_lima.AAC.1